MLERDLQDYLFENPDVLFPDQVIQRKRREVSVGGRRIDLLFEVDGVQYIIELKRDTIRREDIGQVFEYYGLMRQSNETAHFKMILVAPSIPEYRRIPLEEFGIRCVEDAAMGKKAALRRIASSAMRSNLREWNNGSLLDGTRSLLHGRGSPGIGLPDKRRLWRVMWDSLPLVAHLRGPATS
jgi:hypothetical protein